MLRTSITTTSFALALLGASFVSVDMSSLAGASTQQNCAKLTKAVVVADGFTKATGPKVTPYNYKDASKNG